MANYGFTIQPAAAENWFRDDRLPLSHELLRGEEERWGRVLVRGAALHLTWHIWMWIHTNTHTRARAQAQAHVLTGSSRGGGAPAHYFWHARLFLAHGYASTHRCSLTPLQLGSRLFANAARTQTQDGASDLWLLVFQRYNEIIVASPLNGPAHLDQAWASCGCAIHRRPASATVCDAPCDPARALVFVCRRELCKDSLPRM